MPLILYEDDKYRVEQGDLRQIKRYLSSPGLHFFVLVDKGGVPDEEKTGECV